MLRTGIYNVVTDGFRWRHLIFYERDTAPTPEEKKKILEDMSKAKSAFIAYTTKSGGFHVMGLTPVSTIVWAYAFKDLDMDLKGNCSGHVLRCNLKPHEEQQTILGAGFHNYPVADQIYSMVVRKFHLSGYYVGDSIKIEKWKSLFNVYSSGVEMRIPPFKRIDRDAKGPSGANPKETLSSFTALDDMEKIPA